jgi:plasmid rolling circle replication initiator protein Rep
MEIIAENSFNVNRKDETFLKWTTKKLANILVADKLTDAGFEKRGFRMRECGTYLTYKYCPDCGKTFISSSNLCRDKLCPTCSWRLSLKRFAEMCCTINALGDYNLTCAGFLTLTVKNCKPENLKYTIKKMNEDWNRMLAGRRMRVLIIGWARSLEITYNKENNTFHPHFHVIVLFEDLIPEGELNRMFRKAWASACRLPYEPITDFRLIDRCAESMATDNDKIFHAVLETFKYSVKDSEMEDMPIPVFRQFVLAIQGMRFVSFGGIIKQTRRELGLRESEQDDENEIELARDKCTCGANLLKVVCKWSFTEKQYKQLDL